MIYAEVILDSLHPNGKTRLTTIRGSCHRFILAELNTHRAFSRNSASSRAKSLRVTTEQVTFDPAMPVEWLSEQRGMVGGKPLGHIAQLSAIKAWEDAAYYAILHAERLKRLGVHKSVVNRLLEPFMWHEVIITSSRWQNFFRQRVSSLAQPEMREFAERIMEAYNGSYPQPITYGQWHLPFVTSFGSYTYDSEEIAAYALEKGESYHEIAARISSARCARVSYKTLEGIPNRTADLTLFDRLEHPPKDDNDNDILHLSPMEHVARPSNPLDFFSYAKNVGANFGSAWLQYRQIIERRNKYSTLD